MGLCGFGSSGLSALAALVSVAPSLAQAATVAWQTVAACVLEATVVVRRSESPPNGPPWRAIFIATCGMSYYLQCVTRMQWAPSLQGRLYT